MVTLQIYLKPLRGSGLVLLVTDLWIFGFAEVFLRASCRLEEKRLTLHASLVCLWLRMIIIGLEM